MARIVIAGAGAMGASIAYHLAERGAKDVVLVDKGTVASGATAKGTLTSPRAGKMGELAVRRHGSRMLYCSVVVLNATPVSRTATVTEPPALG